MGRTNWFRILIIVSIAFVIGMGIFVYQWWNVREQKETIRQAEMDTIADWATYQNEEFGFEVKYPPDFQKDKESRTKINLTARNLATTLIIAVSTDQSFEDFIKDREVYKGEGELSLDIENRYQTVISGKSAVTLEVFFVGPHLYGPETHIKSSDESIISIYTTGVGDSPGSFYLKEETNRLHNQILSTFRFIE